MKKIVFGTLANLLMTSGVAAYDPEEHDENSSTLTSGVLFKSKNFVTLTVWRILLPRK